MPLPSHHELENPLAQPSQQKLAIFDFLEICLSYQATLYTAWVIGLFVSLLGPQHQTQYLTLTKCSLYFFPFLSLLCLQGRHFIGTTSTIEPGVLFFFFPKEIFSIASLKFIKFLLIVSNFRKEIVCQLLGRSMEIL